MLKFEEWAWNDGRLTFLQYVDLATGKGKCNNCQLASSCKKCRTECLQEDIREYHKYTLSCLGQPASQM